MQKLIIAICLASIANCHLILPTAPIKTFTSKYDECLDDLEKASNDTVEALRKVLDQDWNAALPAAEQAVQDIVQTAQCFANVDTGVHVSDVFYGLMKLGDRKECVVQHLQDAVQEVKNAVSDVMSGDMSGAQQEVQNLIATLQDIQNC